MSKILHDKFIMSKILHNKFDFQFIMSKILHDIDFNNIERYIIYKDIYNIIYIILNYNNFQCIHYNTCQFLMSIQK